MMKKYKIVIFIFMFFCIVGIPTGIAHAAEVHSKVTGVLVKAEKLPQTGEKANQRMIAGGFILVVSGTAVLGYQVMNRRNKCE
ncbi:hypothetical protein CBF30_06625 [Vagococcus entomophilus]|uniref:Gram-positive cocci surface proteins LPxTG domain-containing protein n=2 Tax=Vagococcus entomophilus TaxID=1160095 RepID=A0A430AGB1_9ENTE|nr:hypothetical protein CBF30_06625 [Vagococcus entomophilus]